MLKLQRELQKVCQVDRAMSCAAQAYCSTHIDPSSGINLFQHHIHFFVCVLTLGAGESDTYAKARGLVGPCGVLGSLGEHLALALCIYPNWLKRKGMRG